MARRKPKNIPASVRARLLNLAKAERKNFNNVLLQYFQERFLYRLSVSPYRENFILKGALLFLLYDVPRFRPTRDIDFLGRAQSNDLEHIRTIVQQIAQIEVSDGVAFTPEDTTVEIIKESEEYSGVRVKIEAKLTSARQTLQIDIGFGDRIHPKVRTVQYFTLCLYPSSYGHFSLIFDGIFTLFEFEIHPKRLHTILAISLVEIPLPW